MKWESLGIFLLGFFSCAALIFVFGGELEFPVGTGFSILESDVSAPSDSVLTEDIVVLDDKIILKIEGATLSSYADSGSMLPVFDKGANGIRIIPESADEVEVGDIVSFRMARVLVVHRVVEKGEDEDGVYFVVKGDANLIGDGVIRFEDIEYKTVGVIY